VFPTFVTCDLPWRYDPSQASIVWKLMKAYIDEWRLVFIWKCHVTKNYINVHKLCKNVAIIF
jgi:hypothetical protein